MVLVLVVSSAPAESRILNLHGSLSLSYSLSRATSKRTTTENTAFAQRYSLGAGGKIFRFGDYQLRATWFNDKFKYSTRATGTASYEIQQEVTNQDYQAFTNLFAQKSPLSLSVQRLIQKNEVGSAVTETQIDAFNANWTLGFKRYPKTSLSYARSSLKSRIGNTEPVTNQSFSALSSGRIKDTTMSMGYQWVQSDSGSTGKSTSQGLNANLTSRLSNATQVSAHGRYSTSRFPPSLVVPGITIFQDRSAGISMVYRPPLYWWDARAGYNYSENPFVKDFRVHNLNAGANIRPIKKVDASAGARLTRVYLEDSTLTTENLSGSTTYRPFFGLSTSLGAGFFHTLATAGNANTYSQNYNFSVSYFKNFRNYRTDSSYLLGYSQTRTTPGDVGSDSLSNSFHVSANNTDTRYIHYGVLSTVTTYRTYSNGSDSGGSTFTAGANAGSDYFKNLMLRGDHLSLYSSADYTQHSGIGLSGGSKAYAAGATYSWRRLVGIVTYNLVDYPNRARLDRQSVTAKVSWNTYLWGLGLSMDARDTYIDNRFTGDSNGFSSGVRAVYQLGLVSLTARYIRAVTVTYNEDTTSRSTVDSFSGTLSRPF